MTEELGLCGDSGIEGEGCAVRMALAYGFDVCVSEFSVPQVYNGCGGILERKGEAALLLFCVQDVAIGPSR